jgi:hypothetical protein
MQQTKKKLITLEAERGNLVERLGTKNSAVTPLEQFEKVTRVLERILDRLDAMEKRLQKLQPQK